MPVRIMLQPTRDSNGAAQKDTAIMKTQPKTKVIGMNRGTCGEKNTRDVVFILEKRKVDEMFEKNDILFHAFLYCKTSMASICMHHSTPFSA